ncbi:MAG: serine/threonine-protein kinase [Cyanobacteria bacterium J06648_16]
MRQCLNWRCPQPVNADNAKVCAGCGRSLWILGRYCGLRVLGQGGFGRTVLGEDPHQQRVVLKQLLGDAATGALARFQQEATQLEKLGRHPQIPHLVEFIEDAGEGYGPLLVQEYVAGPTLAQVLEQVGPLGADRVEGLLRDLLPVLEYVHSFRIIHRDIKPENIVMPRGGLPVLVDFGAAKVAVRRSVTVIGSAEYVAPEQAMGKAGFSSDLYSLGVTCLHVLTGMPPFDLYSVSEDQWVWRNFLTEPVGDRLGAVLDGLVVRSPRDRIATAAAALEVLNRPTNPLLRLPPLARKPQPDALPKQSEQPWQRQYQIANLGIAHALAVSNGGLIATGNAAGAVSLWRLADGASVYTFKPRRGWHLWGQGHCDQVSGLCFAPNGRQLYSTSYDGTTKIWDAKSCTLQRTLPRQSWLPSAVAIAPSRLIVAGGEGIITLWDTQTLKRQATLTQHQDRVSALGLTATGQRFASASWDGTLRLWQLPGGELIETIPAGQGRITALAMHPAGLHIVSGGEDGAVKVWALDRSITTDTIYQSPDAITALALSPDARLLAVGTEGNTLSLWDGATGRCVSQLEQGWGVVAVAFSPDGQRLLVSSRDERVTMWMKA